MNLFKNKNMICSILIILILFVALYLILRRSSVLNETFNNELYSNLTKEGFNQEEDNDGSQSANGEEQRSSNGEEEQRTSGEEEQRSSGEEEQRTYNEEEQRSSGEEEQRTSNGEEEQRSSNGEEQRSSNGEEEQRTSNEEEEEKILKSEEEQQKIYKKKTSSHHYTMRPPISISVNYNNRNAISDSNIANDDIIAKNRLRVPYNDNNRQSNSSNRSTIQPSTYNSGDINNNTHSNNTQSNNNTDIDSSYGKVSWSTTSDYYIPQAGINKKQYNSYNEFQDNYNKNYNVNKGNKSCPACPILANRPWSNYKSGDN